MSFEECVLSAQADRQAREVKDYSFYFKDMMAFFWLMTRSQKTRAEVEPILKGYRMVDTIAKKQDELEPQIDVVSAQASLASDSTKCIQKHKWLRVLYALQAPMDDSCSMAKVYAPRDYFDRWLKINREHTKG